ncbi:hypothetical protein SFC65_19065 [Priestia filamentosa]|uniref:hypothetical protein n=1 Tax=Priestia filamentosa TaxID=1402861 RepID=UPI0039826C0F
MGLNSDIIKKLKDQLEDYLVDGQLPLCLMGEWDVEDRIEIIVQCPDCGDQFHTKATLMEWEGCTKCQHPFMIHEQDVIQEAN